MSDDPSDTISRSEHSGDERLDGDICVHIFSASASMVGVCLTAIGLLRVVARLQPTHAVSIAPVAVDALLFTLSCGLSYFALRTRARKRRYWVERLADGLFLAALCLMTFICALFAYEFL